MFVIDTLVQILNKDIAHATPSHAGIALAPHNATRLALDIGKVHGFEGAFGVGDLVVVDVGVAEGATGDGIAADADGGDGTHGVEDFVKEAFGDFREEIAHVEGGGLEGSSIARCVAVSHHHHRGGGGGGGRRRRDGGGGIFHQRRGGSIVGFDSGRHDG